MTHKFPVVLCVGLVWGCASDPLERQELVSLRDQQSPLPRIVSVRVHADESERFGSTREWESEIVRVFEALHVCTEATTSDAVRHEEPDLLLEVTILVDASQGVGGGQVPSADQNDAVESESPEPTTEVDSQGALLSFVAWSTVPLLPLWIDDVHVDPGVTAAVRLAGFRRADTEGSDSVSPVEYSQRCGSVETSYLDRRPVLSWSSLGAIFVPTFVFESPDREHFASAAGARVRTETACGLAALLKRLELPEALEEPVRGLQVVQQGRQLALSFWPHRRLRSVKAWAELAEEPQDPSNDLERVLMLDLTFDSTNGSRGILEELPVDLVRARFPEPASLLLHVEAQNREGWTWRYHLAFPVSEADDAR